ncbi:MAG: site-specific integrase, partial [Dehalococcoidia bacterium]
ITSATLGLRLGELVALRWADVDIDAASLTVRRTGTRLAGQYIEGVTKTEKSRRTISLPPAMVAMLKAQRSAIAVERLRLPAGVWRDEDRVFPGEGGGPCGESTIRRALGRGLARAGLPHLRFHDLRHTAASGLLAAGGSLRDVQELVGHASYTLTADLYTHLAADQRKATADRLEAALGEAISG